MGRRESKSVSRVLYWMIIYLGAAVTGRLKRSTLHQNARRAAASKVHMILHRIGFTWPHNRLCAGELLPRLSTLTRVCGRYLSVALSLGSPPPDVIRYPALWCTDFPRAEARDHLIYFFPSIRKKRLCRKRTGAFWFGFVIFVAFSGCGAERSASRRARGRRKPSVVSRRAFPWRGSRCRRGSRR